MTSIAARLSIQILAEFVGNDGFSLRQDLRGKLFEDLSFSLRYFTMPLRNQPDQEA